MRTNLINNRQIRVFISSTFQDMQDERNYLMKRTFPKLRKLAAERDVTLTELDLRWGITEEEAKSGKVVEICLREIENSIPFFIGIIGNRYGWVPEKKDISENVTDRFKEVDNYLEHHLSVTEMEMQFGVLQRQEDMHAFFYIKEGEDKEDADNPEMLERLKKEVKASRYPSSTYSSPENLAQQVEKAFSALLDQLFPEGHLSEVEKERIGQRSFMNQLCQNYIRDDKNFQLIDEWMSDWDQHQLVITGASGLGKSALIANWLKEKLSDENRDYNIIYHFTGNGSSECSHDFIKSTLINEINNVYNWFPEEDGIRSKKNGKEDNLNDLFIKVASEGRRPLLIVLDAINQIVDIDNAKLLNWLPVPPKNIKILFSTLTEDRTMKVFTNRNYPIFRLKPININQRRRLVKDYLYNQFAKKLSPRQVERIVSDPQCKNPLVLKSLLDELVNFGIFEKLDERIEYYLSKDTIEYFYQAIIQSLEEEFGKILVKRVLSLIAISEKGMSENELITISKTKPLYWSQFYHLFAPHLVTKNGLLTFSHEYVRNAIETQYTKNTKWLKTCRKEIIVYFENEKTNRSYEELAFQYYNLKEYSPLYQLLLSIPAFTYLYDFQKYDLTLYWNTLMGKGYKIGALRETMHSLDQKRKDLYIDVIYFAISELSLYHFAQLVCYDYKAYLDSINDNNSQEYAMLCNCLGNAYYYQSKFRKALLYHEKALEIQKSILGPSHSDIADTHLNIGRVNYRLGNFQTALLNYNDALKIYEEDQDNYLLDMANTYNNIGVVYKDLANYPLSLKYYRKTMEIREKYLGNDYPDTAGSYYNIGIMYCEQGIFSKAQDYCDKALRIQEKLLGVKHIDTTNTYICLGNIHFYQNDNDLALKYYKRALKIQEVILGKDHSITATTYNNIGSIYYNLGNYTMALSYYMKALKIRKKVMSSEHSDTAASLNNIGNVYYRLRNYPMALKYYSKSAKIRESLLGKEHHDTLTSYYYIADVYYEMSNYPLALDYYKMVAIRNYESAYNDLACVYQLMEEYDKALPWAEKAVEAVPQDPNIIDTLATIYQDLGRYDEALEQFELCLKLYKEKENSEGINRTETKIAELKELMK